MYLCQHRRLWVAVEVVLLLVVCFLVGVVALLHYRRRHCHRHFLLLSFSFLVSWQVFPLLLLLPLFLLLYFPLLLLLSLLLLLLLLLLSLLLLLLLLLLYFLLLLLLLVFLLLLLLVFLRFLYFLPL